MTAPDAPPAIRIRGVSRYVAAPLEMDGATRPREAFRALMSVAGIHLKPPPDEVQATVAAPGYVLRDISLDIAQGSVVCLMGGSGADATALLQVLSGVAPPTAGRVEIYGPLTSLLSMSGDLDMRGTARENIQASETWADADPGDAEEYAAAVIDFADLHDFEDVPLRTYSTGMLMRLNVALALCGHPSIVLIDDVLRVGDIAFQQKCVERVQALKDSGCTLVLSFADDTLVQQFATRVVTLAGGRIVGDTADPGVAPIAPARSAEISWQVYDNLPEDDVAVFQSFTVDAVRDGDETFLDVRLTVMPKVDRLRCRPVLSVVSEAGVLLYRSAFPDFVPAPARGPLVFAVKVPTRMLPSGRYTLAAAMASRQDTRIFATKANDSALVTIRREEPEPAEADAPLLQPMLAWDTDVVEAAGRA